MMRPRVVYLPPAGTPGEVAQDTYVNERRRGANIALARSVAARAARDASAYQNHHTKKGGRDDFLA